MFFRIIFGLVVGFIIIYTVASITPKFIDPRIVQPIYTQKDSYAKNEFESEEERRVFEGIRSNSSEKDKYMAFSKLQNLNPKKDFYNTETKLWKEKFDESEKKRLAAEKKAEEERLAQAKKAEEQRLAKAKKEEEDRKKADLEREKRYADARRRDGIFSQSQAFEHCKRELRATTNSGYYMQYSEAQMRRLMTNQLDSCMYKYGYFGN